MSKPLRVVNPVDVTDSMLLACNVPEADYPAWSAATAYATGARVLRTATHRIYERLVAGTTATAPESDSANWADVSASNRWKMFDTTISSRTAHAGQITLTLAPGTIHSSVAFIDVIARSVRVKQVNAVDGVIYDQTINLQSPPEEANFWSYVFDPIVCRRTAVMVEMPLYGASTTLEITIDNGTGVAECGALLVGRTRSLGNLGVQRGAQVGIQDYSRKERNDYGEYTIVPRAYSKRAQIDILIPNGQLDATQNLFADLRTRPTLWVGHDDYEALVIYGYYKEFAAVISYPDFSQCHLEIEGLI